MVSTSQRIREEIKGKIKHEEIRPLGGEICGLGSSWPGYPQQ
jgi:hypothetical protein